MTKNVTIAGRLQKQGFTKGATRLLIGLYVLVHLTLVMLNILCTMLFPNFYPVNLQHSTCKHEFTEWKTVWILIKWLHQMPVDLDLQFSKKDKSGFCCCRSIVISWSLFCNTLLSVLSSFAIILTMKRELVALL